MYDRKAPEIPGSGTGWYSTWTQSVGGRLHRKAKSSTEKARERKRGHGAPKIVIIRKICTPSRFQWLSYDYDGAKLEKKT